jgi:hypothetical protein
MWIAISTSAFEQLGYRLGYQAGADAASHPVRQGARPDSLPVNIGSLPAVELQALDSAWGHHRTLPMNIPAAQQLSGHSNQCAHRPS